ncbi:MAG: hypothetical protein EA378_08230 [Phycisphaerales bacterium]|nr:MAG: hypothetical protein EA378_08230 [Phycisphaerales bacterium]
MPDASLPITHATPSEAGRLDLPGFATLIPGNPAEGLLWARAGGTPEQGRWLSYAGWIGEQPGAGLGVFAPDFATWGPTGRTCWLKMLAEADAYLNAHDERWCLRPHARHLLPDPQQCLNLLRSRADQESGGPARIELILEPTAFLTPQMLPTGEDHIARAVAALGDRPEVVALIATNVRTVARDGAEAELALCEVEEGELPPAWILEPLEAIAARRGLPLFRPSPAPSG